MGKEDLDLVKEAFNEDGKRWTDIIFQRIFAYNDLRVRIAEREFQFVLFLTTISVAFLALILPLILNFGYEISNIAIFGFLTSSTLGFIRIILSIIFDKKEIPKDEKFELDYLQNCQRLAVEIYNDALSKTVDNNKLEKYFGLGKNVRDLASEREKEKYVSNRILFIIHYLFLASFAIGFISLFYGIIYYLWCSQ